MYQITPSFSIHILYTSVLKLTKGFDLRTVDTLDTVYL